MDILLRRDANIDCTHCTCAHFTPLERAASDRSLRYESSLHKEPVTPFLLQWGASVRDNSMYSVVLPHSCPDNMRSLLQHGGNPNARFSGICGARLNERPLHQLARDVLIYTSISDNPSQRFDYLCEAVMLFIEAGGNVEVQDANGNRPIDIAPQTEIITLFNNIIPALKSHLNAGNEFIDISDYRKAIYARIALAIGAYHNAQAIAQYITQDIQVAPVLLRCMAHYSSATYKTRDHEKLQEWIQHMQNAYDLNDTRLLEMFGRYIRNSWIYDGQTRKRPVTNIIHWFQGKAAQHRHEHDGSSLLHDYMHAGNTQNILHIMHTLSRYGMRIGIQSPINNRNKTPYDITRKWFDKQVSGPVPSQRYAEACMKLRMASQHNFQDAGLTARDA